MSWSISVECESDAILEAENAVSLVFTGVTGGAYQGTPPTTPVCLSNPQNVTVRVTHDAGFCDVDVTITGDITKPSFLPLLPGDLDMGGFKCIADADAYFNSLTLPIATDNCDPNPMVSVSSVYNTTPGPGATICTNNVVIERRFSAMDECGNVRSFQVFLTVVDDVKPTITTPEGGLDMTFQCDADAQLYISDILNLNVIPMAVDNCGGTPTISLS